jgi:hypothetical protein
MLTRSRLRFLERGDSVLYYMRLSLKKCQPVPAVYQPPLQQSVPLQQCSPRLCRLQAHQRESEIV